MAKRINTAECLSGGACKGFFDIGYMNAREENGLAQEDTYKGGVSTGSIWSSLMSVGVSSKEIKDYVYANEQEFSKGLFKKELSKILSLPKSSYRYTYNLLKELNRMMPDNYHNGRVCTDENGYAISEEGNVLPRTGISSTKTLEKFIREFLGNKKFCDLPDLTVYGTDMEKGELLPFSHETTPYLDVAEGVIISCSVVPLFPIRKVDYDGESRYVADGGFAINFPMHVPHKNNDIDNIIGINLMDASRKNENSIKDHWLLDFVNSGTFSNAYKTRMIFDMFLGKNYDEAVDEECFETRVNGKRRKVLLLTPDISNDYLLKTDIESFEELYKMGYEMGLRCLDKFDKFRSKKKVLGLF